MNETIYILLPVHNRREITRLFVNCLKNQTYSPYHLVLIDDGSTDGTEAMVRSIIAPVTVLKGHGDWWWAGSLQQGYRWLKEHNAALDEIVLIINDDTQFGSDFLEKGVELLRDHTGAIVLAKCYSKHTGQLCSTGVHVDWKRLFFHQAGTHEEVNCMSTRGLFLTVTDFFRLGGFHPILLPHYLSDYEFTIRAYRSGMRLVTSDSLQALVDTKATGYRIFGSDDLPSFLRKCFSTKSAINPFHWTMFVILACPWKWKPMALMRVWKRTACALTHASVISVRKIAGSGRTAH